MLHVAGAVAAVEGPVPPAVACCSAPQRPAAAQACAGGAARDRMHVYTNTRVCTVRKQLRVKGAAPDRMDVFTNTSVCRVRKQLRVPACVVVPKGAARDWHSCRQSD